MLYVTRLFPLTLRQGISTGNATEEQQVAPWESTFTLKEGVSECLKDIVISNDENE